MLQVKGEKPPAPTRGLTAGGGDADDDEDEVDADDKDDDKIDDSLPRTDIRCSIFICINQWVHVPYYRISGFFHVHPFSAMFARVSKS